MGKKNKSVPSCTTCEEFIPIGEGGHICGVNNALLTDDYEPNGNYFWCDGKHYEER